MVGRCSKTAWTDLINVRLFQKVRDIILQSIGFLHFRNNEEVLLILEDLVLYRLQIAIFINYNPIMEKIFVDNSFPFPIKQCWVTFTRVYTLLPFHNIVNGEVEDKCL